MQEEAGGCDDSDPAIRHMLRNKIALTQKNYLDIRYWGSKPSVEDLSSEEQEDLQSSFFAWPVLMTEVLAELLITKLNITGCHAEVCELLADETSTIHDSLVGIGEEATPPTAPPTSVVCGYPTRDLPVRA